MSNKIKNLNSLFSKVKEIGSNEEAKSTIKVAFKSMKRKKFIKRFNKDVKKYYTDKNVNIILEQLSEDKKKLEGITPTTTVERIKNRGSEEYFSNKKANIVKIISNLNVFEVYSDISLHSVGFNFLKDNLKAGIDVLGYHDTIKNEVYSLIESVRNVARHENLEKILDDKLLEISSEVEDYKTSLEIIL